MIKLTVVGLTVGKNAVTLIMDNGDDMVLESKAWRTKGIIDDLVVPLAQNGSYDIDLSKYSLAAMIEKATGGEVTIVETGDAISNDRKDVDKSSLGKNYAIQTSDGTIVKDGVLLEKQIEQAIFGRTAKGFAKFLKKFGAIERKHSMDDLLAFMEGGGLMIADDGCIVAYKRLNKRGDLFYDCHTGTVPQRVGSIVHMDEADVDPSRSSSCSYGLHICSPNYLSSFGGSALTLVKVDPADVIAVPNYEKSKMRVKRYTIVAELTDDMASFVTARKKLTDHREGCNIIANVIAGKHVKPFEEVKVGKKGIAAKIVGDASQNTKIVEEKADVSKLADTDNGVSPMAVKSLVSAAINGDMSAAITEGAKAQMSRAKAVDLDKLADNKVGKVVNGKKVETTLPNKVKTERKKPQPKKVKTEKAAPVAEAGKFATYAEKLAEARRLKDDEKLSLREIAKRLGMDRESLSKNLKK